MSNAYIGVNDLARAIKNIYIGINGEAHKVVNAYVGVNGVAQKAYSSSIIYGAEWDGTSTTLWTRTDSASDFADPVPYVSGATSYGSPFDNIYPWAGMTKVESAQAGTLVRIPKFWYKLTQNGDAIKIQIANEPLEGYVVSPAHMDRGDGAGERDVVYIGRYHCAENTYKSTTGVKPQASITRSAARSSIHSLGTSIWQSDFAARFTLWLLYIVEFADWNSQAKIGKGCGDGSATGNMGYTDSMPYHTGTTQNSRDTYGLGTQYRNIEGLWDNVRDWCDGSYYNSSGLNIILDPADFSDSTGGSVAGLPTSGYPSKFTVSSTGGYPVFYPTESKGSDSTVSCDYWYFNASSPCLYVGGCYSRSAFGGLFFVYSSSATSTYASIGCRLMELWSPSLDANGNEVKYAVQLYGIRADTIRVDNANVTAGLTFGPALGLTPAQTGVGHTPTGTSAGGNPMRCIHDDDWATIAYWSKTDPTVYADCIANGCTHAVRLNLNDTIKGNTLTGFDETSDGSGVIYSNIAEAYSRWNPQSNVDTSQSSSTYGSNKYGWSGSKIRATLNGSDSSTKSAVALGTNAADQTILSSSNCLLSCFDPEVRSIIAPKVIQGDDDYYGSPEASTTTYDKLWLFSTKEIGFGSSVEYSSNRGSDYSEKRAYWGVGDGSRSNCTKRVGYRENGIVSYAWLRSPFSYNAYVVWYLGNRGGISNSRACGTFAVAPGFCLP